MRAVIDTKVFISAALKSDSILALAVATVLQYGTLLKSEATERQLFDVLARPISLVSLQPLRLRASLTHLPRPKR